MRFPIKESEILLLAQEVAAGLTANPATFPAPPVAPGEITADLNALSSAYAVLTAARAALESALTAKDAAIARLADNIKSDLRYAENITGFNDEKLKRLGWSGRRAKRKLTCPGQPLELQCSYNVSNQPVLFWQQPQDGGRPSMYKILRRSLDGTLPDGSNGTWHEVASSLTNEKLIKNQPTGHRMEFAVRAVNRSGESIESNAVEITL